MSKHTPGPWLTDGRSVFAMEQKQICEVPAKGIRSGKVDVANARLIAAVPELLKALKDAHPHIADDTLRTRIGNLIAKAEGSEV